MLFITNRVLKQNNQTRHRAVDFDLRDTNALQSLFFCERVGQDDYNEIGSVELMRRLKDSPAEQVLAFIHGFNNLPEDAAFQRAEQLQAYLDARRPNLAVVVPVIWPCAQTDGTAGFIRGYYDDQAAADSSATAFGRALAKLQEWQLANIANDTPCLKRLNVLAHSMGNRVLRGAIRWWSQEILGAEPPLLFRNIFMAAADVENETLERTHEGGLIPMAARNVVVYHTFDDMAMRASKAANAGIRSVSRRLGHTGPYDMTKVPANVYAASCDAVALAYDPNRGHTYFIDVHNAQPGSVFAHVYNSLVTARPEHDGTNRYTVT